MAVLDNLQPKAVFKYFEALCSVPHGSGNTKIISDLLVSFAKELGLKYRQDEVNNVVIFKDASAGYENAPTVMLQGHMDMVCVKTDDCTKDMARDGLDVMTDGQWVWADKTSLGGDDGIAVAMALAILADDTLPHPALEAVFTVDEETSMQGAEFIDVSDLKSKMLINIDSEEDGVITVSCAGSETVENILPAKLSDVKGDMVYAHVLVDGLLGGHSGAEIHLGRGNSNVLTARFLYNAAQQIDGLRLVDMAGGKFHNVICPRTDSVVAIPADKKDMFAKLADEYNAILKNEFVVCDKDVNLAWEAIDDPNLPAASAEDTIRLLSVLIAVPNGFIAPSRDFEGLTQTSISMGKVSMEEDGLHFATMARSAVDSERVALVQKVKVIVGLAGGSSVTESCHGAWQYKRDSLLRDVFTAAYKKINGKEAKVYATHGGVECGIFGAKMPGIDAVSVGPDMFDIHSERERLSVPTTESMYKLICEVLKNIK